MLLAWVWLVWPLNRIRRMNVIEQGAQRVLCLLRINNIAWTLLFLSGIKLIPSIVFAEKLCRWFSPECGVVVSHTQTDRRTQTVFLLHTLENTDYGLVLVLALPLGVAVERSVHNFWNHFSFSSVSHTFLPEGVVIGLWNFARSLKSHKNKIGGKNKLRNPPTPCFFCLKAIFFWCAWEAHLNVPLSRAQHNCNWMI